MELEECVLVKLECPTCFKYMSPPIRVCSKGHSACDNCAKKFTTCTSCRYPFLTTRNLVLESLVYEVGIECQKCNKRYTSDIYYSHNCVDAMDANEYIYKCRVEIVYDNYSKKICRWRGYTQDVENHFLTTHRDNHFCLDDGRVFKWKLPYEQDQENISVIKKRNLAFLQEIYYENKTKKLHFALYNLNKNNGFSYEIVVGRCGRRFVNDVFDFYINIQRLIRTTELIEIDVDVFMPKDREISWILIINEV